MSIIGTETIVGVECHTAIVRLELPEELLGQLIDLKRGALRFPGAQVRDGAMYVTSWYAGGAVMVAFHAESAMPVISRDFVLAPMHHTFVRDPQVELHPLGGLSIPTASGTLLFTLYEAIYVIRTDPN